MFNLNQLSLIIYITGPIKFVLLSLCTVIEYVSLVRSDTLYIYLNFHVFNYKESIFVVPENVLQVGTTIC